MLDGFLNLVDRIQNEGTGTTDILRQLITIKQQNEEAALRAQQAAQLRQNQYAQNIAEQNRVNSIVSQNNARNNIINQIQTNNNLFDFQSQVHDQNIASYMSNIAAIQQTIGADKEMFANILNQKLGESRSSFAARGVIVDTGSATDVSMNIASEVGKSERVNYVGKLNQINSILSKINDERVQNYATKLSTEAANQQLSNKLTEL